MVKIFTPVARIATGFGVVILKHPSLSFPVFKQKVQRPAGQICPGTRKLVVTKPQIS